MTAYNSEVSGDSEELVNANIADVIAYLKEVGLKLKLRKMLQLNKRQSLSTQKLKTLTRNQL